MAKKSKKIVAKKRVRKNISSGVVHIQSTFNNTIVTIADENGNTIAWSSSGVQKFKGSRKSTPFAAKLVAEDAGQKAMEQGLKNISIFITDHNAREIFSIVDRSYLIQEGQVMMEGSVTKLINSKRARKYYLGEDFKV